MKETYRRIFGAGPRGAIVAIVLFLLFNQFHLQWRLSPVFQSDLIRISMASFAFLLAGILLTWALLMLPVRQRGKALVTGGCFGYFRHPLYAAFVSFFNFGLAIVLNSWYFLIWALVTHIFFHFNVRSEERFMRSVYGSEYVDYCKKTGRFLPKFSQLFRSNFHKNRAVC